VKEEPCPTSTFDEALAGLGERLGHPFARPELLRTALTHRSFLNEHPDRPEQDNQRLEFLGDAVPGHQRSAISGSCPVCGRLHDQNPVFGCL